MILPYFDYGDVFLINANQQLLGKIQRIQNRGLKICLGVEARTRTSDVGYISVVKWHGLQIDELPTSETICINDLKTKVI